MCGIAGILNLNTSQPADPGTLEKMGRSIEHRGPDSSGIFTDNNLGFAFRRLSILDTSSAGDQPMTSANGRYTIVFNGEIYNYKDFYPELHAKGITTRSGADSEVMLYLWQLYGAAVLPRLHGMFAFAIWDAQERSLVVCRDRMGVKPLYYAQFKDSFLFASEPKALLVAGVEFSLQTQHIPEFLLCRYVAGEEMLYKHIKRLLPGHWMKISADGKMQQGQWFNLREAIGSYETPSDPAQWFREKFDESVRLRMVSDVPVGLLLSSGLDSSSVAASLHAQHYQGINTFTIGFAHQQHNETRLAQQLSAQFDFPFHQRRLEGEELHAHFRDANWYCGEPLVHLNEPHLLAISRLAKTKVKVLLSGESADELFGGYVRYRPLGYTSLFPMFASLVRLGVLKSNRWKKLERFSHIRNQDDLVIYNASNFFPEELTRVLGISHHETFAYRRKVMAEARAMYSGDLRRQAMYFDQQTYLCSLLDRNDRTTMGAGIECREPFLHNDLVAGAGRLSSDWMFKGKKGKHILLKAVGDRLPEAIRTFPKIGLSVPWADILRTDPCFVDDLQRMKHSDMFELDFFNQMNPVDIVDRFMAGDNSLSPFIFQLFSFYGWYHYYPQYLKQYQ